MTKNEINNNDFKVVLEIIQNGSNKLIKQANTVLIDTYWNIGSYLTEKVSNSHWGKGVVIDLAHYITKEAPEVKGFSASNLWRMKQFFEIYSSEEKLATLSREISWSHHCTLLSQCKNIEEHIYYANISKKALWTVRTLRKQIKNASFERSVLADKKLSPIIKKLPQNIKGIFKDSYLIDFADLSEPHLESNLQSAIISNLKNFLLELGNGFTFVGENIKLQVGNNDFKLDLLFFHRELQSLVAFELKRSEFRPKDLGQLSFYMEALDRQYKLAHENQSIGVLLCRSKDDEVVEFALNRTNSPALVAEYETKLIPKKLLKAKLNEWYNLLETETD